MRVAIVSPGILPVPPVSGGAVENLIFSIIRKNEELARMDLTIFSVYDEKSVLEAKQYQHTRFIFIQIPRFLRALDRCIYWTAKNILRNKKNMSYRYILQRIHFIRRTADTLHRLDYDRIVFENHPTLLMALKRRGNVHKYAGKYDFHLHNVMTKDFGCSALIENCHKILSVSDYIRRDFHARYLNISPEKLTVLRNCIDTDRFHGDVGEPEKMNAREKYGIGPNDSVVLFSGRLTPEKGIRELLRAFRKIKQENAKLMIVGSFFFASDTASKFEWELKTMAKEMQDKIVFTGFVPYSRMQECYAAADVAVLPSIWDDPAPLAIIESLACGLPVITTYSGGIPEYVNEKCAVLLNRDEKLVDHLAEAIDRLLSDRTLRKQMSDHAKGVAAGLNLENYYVNFVNGI